MTAEAQQRTEAHEGRGSRVLGLVTDPDMPTQIGTQVARKLTDWLRDRTGNEWTVEVVSDPLTAGEADSEQILKSVERHLSDQGWACAVCVTDLPLLLQAQPLLADGSTSRRVAVVSLPALGGLQPYRRVRQTLVRLLDELLEPGTPRESSRATRLTSKLASVRRASPQGSDIDIRYTATRARGWIRLVTGMVRTNRPATLIFGLSSALAAALATSAFGLSSSTIWQIADQLDPARKVVAGFAAVVILVGWLTTAHRLWERVGHRESADRRLVALYNASTLATLTIGVGCMYVGLFAANLVVAWFLVTPAMLTSMLGHFAGTASYVSLAWGFTTMGVIAGALGSSLESDRAVRQAAYGYREEQRRARDSGHDRAS